MTGGEIEDQPVTGPASAQTEMSVDFRKWDIVNSASLPGPLVFSAALTLNNQVYLFGNISKPERFSLKLLNDM